ncbi:Retrovirus-related Pol polyprotein from transposon RE1 [Vitis vinifera]|uniref:Retrovirus-related Pol polyprotein from transposon RE1 n=1 Tax=Vitis vinifera TaxID=29760 RepID=A0A438HW46_VITVI|nr:Retrovirus-related Pol polyprotein from transposon RE1 [Vitis vinifera]
MAPVNQTNGEVLRSDPSAEARRGNPTTTDESLRMIISPLKHLPPKMVTDGTGILVPNPKFRDYNAKIISFEVWNTISQNFNSQSSAKVMFYKSQMQMLKKDGLTMRDYLTKMKNYCDLLATAGNKISDTDHILAIMQGLGEEYESVIAVISSKKSSPSLQYVTSTLIAHEGRIAHKISSTDLSVNYTSQYSNRGSSSWNSNGYPSSGFQNRNQFGGNQMTRGSFVPNRGRGRGRTQGGIKPQCQLCNKFGHTVHRCFYRYDPNFHRNMPANGPTPCVLGSGAKNGASGSNSSAGNVNLTEYDAQEDQDYSKMEAMVATPEDLQNCCWFPDSGATNHVTHDLGNLNSGTEYNGLTLLAQASLPLKYWPDAFSTVVFLINSSKHKRYKCLNQQGRMFISRSVIFDETKFPFADKPQKPIQTISHSTVGLPCIPLVKNLEPISVSHSLSLPTSSAQSSHQLDENPGSDIRFVQQDLSNTDSSSTMPILNESASISSSSLCALPGTIPLSTNSDEPNGSINTRPVTLPQQPHHMITRSKNEAISHPKWKEAMNEEFRALMKNKTWSLVPLPSDRTSVGCRWVFKLKRNPDGSISRYKARLVAKGYSQVPGFDFSETFIPVVKPTTIRVVLAIAVSQSWSIRQLDVNNAFLNGELQEEVYMDQPPGFDGRTNQDQKLVCKLHKALYGLKQAPRAWFDKLKISLQQFGFSSTKSDQSLFVRFTNCSSLFVLVYVNDIVVTGSSSQEIQELISKLSGLFSLKDLGELSYFLGIEVKKTTDGGLHLSKKKYIQDLLKKTKMDGAKSLPTPMLSGLKLSAEMGDPIDNVFEYRSVVGALQYRNGTIDLGIVLKPSETMNLMAFCDADWGSDVDDRRSTSGHCVFLGKSLVSWSSKKQHTISRSSTEAEYRSLASLTSELLWLQSLLSELKSKMTMVPVIWCDNISTVSLSANPVLHSRTKHMELDLYFVREKVMERKLVVNHVPAEDQIADVLTKPLSFRFFDKLRGKLTVTSLDLKNGD